MSRRLVLLAVMAALIGAAGPVAADETTFCNFYITSLPYTINTQGHYCFNQNLSTAITSGQAITINSDFVVLDLNNFKLGGGGAGLGTTTYGIYTGNKNIVIRNGNIRGFYTGIHLHQVSSNVTIEDVTLDGNTYSGMRVRGTGGLHVVRRNTIASTGGSTDATTSGDAYGINHVDGPAQIHDNTVVGTFASGGTAYNIRSWDPILFNNRVIGDGTGFGIYMSTAGALYENNTVKSVTTAYSGGTSLGSNYP